MPLASVPVKREFATPDEVEWPLIFSVA